LRVERKRKTQSEQPTTTGRGRKRFARDGEIKEEEIVGRETELMTCQKREKTADHRFVE